jgi:SET domain-containing protein
MWAGLDKESGWRSTGMWILASYINHSCNPNSVRCFIGDMIIIRAARDLPTGTELMISYVPPTEAEPGAIHERLRRSWGFDCDCVICADDGGT